MARNLQVGGHCDAYPVQSGSDDQEYARIHRKLFVNLRSTPFLWRVREGGAAFNGVPALGFEPMRVAAARATCGV